MNAFSTGLGLLAALLLLALAIRRWVGRPRLERIIFEADTPAGKRFDLALLIAIALSVLLVALESDPRLRGQYRSLFEPLELLFSSLFSLEYLLRLLCSKRPWPYARSFFGLVDLVSSLPPLLTLGIPAGQSLLIVRVLRLLRVFRILRLGSYLDEAQLLRQALVASRRKISVFLLTIVALVVLIGTLMYVIEGERSGFTSIPVGIYWAIVTITTVGYGDVAPVTTLGRFVASLVMLLGYSIIAVPTGIVSASLQEAQREQRQSSSDSCPHCGKTLSS
ncbi:MAG: ion transporter [Vulcanococcus sp.]|uniref:ion transporter n=1 Tax=Vulcanococcus sp. TaxID=2856995 RepID=UPI0025CC7AF0|nr:ion transporter [Vulcanococcus sp.]MBW0174345.1 ion transporter [Vulcanococcus sp.]MBW0181863.1 ion transporter [Vulcanococcus sp.]